jgi:hypothetical protein
MSGPEADAAGATQLVAIGSKLSARAAVACSRDVLENFFERERHQLGLHGAQHSTPGM